MAKPKTPQHPTVTTSPKDLTAALAQVGTWAQSIGGRAATVTIVVADGKATIDATDLAVHARATINADGAGTFHLPVAVVREIVKTLVADKSVSLVHVDDDTVEIRQEGSSTFTVVPTRDDLVVPFDRAAHTWEDLPFGSDDVVEVARRVAYAASPDDSRPIITGVHVHSDDGKATAVGTDSYRLAVLRTNFDYTGGPLLIPAAVLTKVVSFLGKAPDVQIQVAAPFVRFVANDGRLDVVARLIDGDFPPYKNLIPDTANMQTAVTDRAEAVLLATQAQAIVEAESPIRLKVDQGVIVEIVATRTDVGSSEYKNATKTADNALVLGFNPKYLIAALGAVKGDKATLHYQDARNPGVITGDDPDRHFTILMPVRLPA